MGVEAEDIVLVEEITDWQTQVNVVETSFSQNFTKTKQTTHRWWKFQIEGSKPTSVEASVDGKIVFKCYDFNCGLFTIDLTTMKGDLHVQWHGAGTSVSVYEYTRRGFRVVGYLPLWWTTPMFQQLERWALQGLVHANDAVFRSSNIFSESACNACPSGLRCLQYI